MPRVSKHTLTIMGTDALVIIAAIAGALLLRFDGHVPYVYWSAFVKLAPLFVAVHLAVFLYFRLYARVWKYAGLEDLLAVIGAASWSMVIVVLAIYIFPLPRLPRSIYILGWLIMIVSIGTSRIWWRVTQEYRRKKDRNLRRVLIVGAGSAGAMLIREIQSNPHLGMKAVVLVDDDPRKLGSKLLGVPIKGNRQDIPRLVIDLMIEEIIIAMPSIKGPPMRGIINICEQTTASLRILPNLYEISMGSIMSQVRNIKMDDLLSRYPIQINMKQVCRYLEGKVVLVTGGGGSIGSELCRQILNYNPKQLIIVDSSENNLFDIDTELKEAGWAARIFTQLLDIKNLSHLEVIFRNYHPQVVFHAAAFKHVPMMERHPEAAFSNNVLGTRNVAELAEKYHSETFILISTDKAVNPTSVMGASKRMAELVMQDIGQNSSTNFAAVRFGNVLGSRGSVIPTFERQIEKGGPVTVTHPNMKRYFMTIREAVQLVLQAGALTEGGEIFVLDMGEPVKIDDLARDLIRLYGLQPGIDIDIVYTGIRPGEKMYEELFSNSEEMESTRHERIFISHKENKSDYAGISQQLDVWMRNNYFDSEAIINLLYDVVPEYRRQRVGDRLKLLKKDTKMPG